MIERQLMSTFVLVPFRLRQVDVKAEHFERQVTRIESERDAMEKKYEEVVEKYNVSKRELEEVSPLPLLFLSLSLDGLTGRVSCSPVQQLAQQMESI